MITPAWHFQNSCWPPRCPPNHANSPAFGLHFGGDQPQITSEKFTNFFDSFELLSGVRNEPKIKPSFKWPLWL